MSALSEQEIADSAWSWVGDRLAHWFPFHLGDRFHVSKAQRVPELAIALLSHRESGLPEHDVFPRIEDALTRIRADASLMDRLTRSPQEFAIYLDIYALTRMLGLDDLELRTELERALAWGIPAQSERLPHREMDVRLSLDWAQLGGSDETWDSLIGRSILGRLPDIAHLDEPNLYAVTHVILFAHAFGLPSPSPWGVAATRPVERFLTGALSRALRERHWDLVAEFLLCWDLVGLPWTPAYELAWQRLLEQRDGAGAFPGPRSDTRGAPPREADDEALYVAHHYHTTLMVVMVCAQRRRRLLGTAHTPPLAWDPRLVQGDVAAIASVLAGTDAAPLPSSPAAVGPHDADDLGDEALVLTTEAFADPDRRLSLALADRLDAGALHALADEPWLPDALESIAACEYREGRLATAARLWRSWLDLDPDGEAVVRVAGLLMLTERRDGGFGRFGPELRELARRGIPIEPDPFANHSAEVLRTLRAVERRTQRVAP